MRLLQVLVRIVTYQIRDLLFHFTGYKAPQRITEIEVIDTAIKADFYKAPEGTTTIPLDQYGNPLPMD